MTTGERIKARRKELGIGQTQLAELIGSSKQNLYKYENGIIANIPVEKIEALAKALHTTPGYLSCFTDNPSVLTGEYPDNIMAAPVARVPLLGEIACGRPILALEENQEMMILPDGIDADFCLRCKGDSMINARIFDGDLVYIKKQPLVDNGEIAAVIIGDEATLKKVFYTPGSDRITLRACNPLYSDLEYAGESLNRIQILGKAVAFTSVVRL